MQIDIKEIKPLHKKFRDEQNLDSLVESIKTVGIIEPIILNERNELIAGRRRYFAAKKAKLEKIPVEYFKKTAIDQELAEIDSNLMILPLGDVDHDQALAKRKKLYEQKYPESRQYAATHSDRKGFARDVSDTIGIAKRSVELAVARAEKASTLVTNARREGKISSTVVNALVKLPKSYQDKILPVIDGKRVSEVKSIVELALERDVDYAISKSDKMIKKGSTLDSIDSSLDSLKVLLEKAVKKKLSVNPKEASGLVKRCHKVAELMETFITLYTPVYEPILRKRSQELAG